MRFYRVMLIYNLIFLLTFINLKTQTQPTEKYDDFIS